MSSNPSAISQLSGLFGSSSPSSQTSETGIQPMGSNQYGSYPNTPGVVPTQGSLPGSNYNTPGPGGYASYPFNDYQPGNVNVLSEGYRTMPTMDPFLTEQYMNMLSGQVGQGVPAFNLSSMLPSSGQATQSGQLNAPLNDVYQQLQKFLTGGQSNMPGAQQATQMAQTGNPIDQLPAWQAMIAAQQQNTDVNAANLREQFAFGGDLKSSPFGSAMQQFYNQNTLNQNAQLTAATADAQNQAQQRELAAQQGIQGLAGQTGSNLQSIDQNAINTMLQEFNYTLPQNNPLLQLQAQGATAQPGLYKGNSVFSNIMQMGNMLLGNG